MARLQAEEQEDSDPFDADIFDAFFLHGALRAGSGSSNWDAIEIP